MILWFYKRAGGQHSLLATGPEKQRTGKRNKGEDSYSLAKHVLPHSLVQPPGTYSLCRAFWAEGRCVEHHHKHLPLLPNTVLPACPPACTYSALPPAAGMEIWRKGTSWLLVEPGPLRKQTPRNGASFHLTCCTFLSLKLHVYSADGNVLPQGSTVEPNMPGKGSLSLMSSSKPPHIYLSSCHFLNWRDFL